MRMLLSKMVPLSVVRFRVDADVLEKGEKKISVFRQERIRVAGAKVEQKFTFLHFTFSGGRGAGLTKEYPSIT